MNYEQTAILAASLQHMRNEFNAGVDLSYLDGFKGFDPETMNNESDLDAIEDELLGKEPTPMNPTADCGHFKGCECWKTY